MDGQSVFVTCNSSSNKEGKARRQVTNVYIIVSNNLIRLPKRKLVIVIFKDIIPKGKIKSVTQ